MIHLNAVAHVGDLDSGDPLVVDHAEESILTGSIQCSAVSQQNGTDQSERHTLRVEGFESGSLGSVRPDQTRVAWKQTRRVRTEDEPDRLSQIRAAEIGVTIGARSIGWVAVVAID